MAKGRKLTSSRSERYLESFNYDQGHGGGGGAAHAPSSELGEDEVWSMVDDSGVAAVESDDWSSRADGGGGYRIQQRPPPRVRRHRHVVGGLSLAFDNSTTTSSPTIVHQFRTPESVAESPRGGGGGGGGRHMATSAPVNVPDWSRIYRVNSVESMHDSDDGMFCDDESEVVPPHEYLAREYARSRKMVANSVFEGVGRTLKGRDMSRVRDAVWSQTGFDG